MPLPDAPMIFGNGTLVRRPFIPPPEFKPHDCHFTCFILHPSCTGGTGPRAYPFAIAIYAALKPDLLDEC
eukprot:scaffold7987_cov200-Cylindrotheca_fusiformis.AAC.17